MTLLAVTLGLLAVAIGVVIYGTARDRRTLKRLQQERALADLALKHRAAHINGALTQLGRDADDLFTR